MGEEETARVRLRSYIELMEEMNSGKGEEPFAKSPHIGWWKDSDHVDVYHGTHERNVSSIRSGGLNHPDPRTGKVSVTLDPHTAHAYASMSGAGGEHDFRRAGSKASTTPHSERAVAHFRVPREWLHSHMDHELSGNINGAREKMSSKEHYDSWKKSNPARSDHEYYQTSEIRLHSHLPSAFYVGHMKKVGGSV